MTYKKVGNTLILTPPDHFSFDECLVYLNRSDIECLHRVEDNAMLKVIEVEGRLIMTKTYTQPEGLVVDLLDEVCTPCQEDYIASYIWTMFDLDTDLDPYYALSKSDRVLGELTGRYEGLRIIKINDLFEALCWAVIGQQINLKFAYTLKHRLCDTYGKSLEYRDRHYYTFPDPGKIADLEVEDLKALQFTGRKSEYLIGIARLFESGDLSRESLERLGNFTDIQNALLAIRGVGKWTADYTIMKCFTFNEAFPIADVGLHNGLKVLLGRTEKPSLEEIAQIAIGWEGWQAYATFYVWRSLYGESV